MTHVGWYAIKQRNQNNIKANLASSIQRVSHNPVFYYLHYFSKTIQNYQIAPHVITILQNLWFTPVFQKNTNEKLSKNK